MSEEWKEELRGRTTEGLRGWTFRRELNDRDLHFAKLRGI